MRFNWIISFDVNDEMKKLCVDMEYLLREKISKFLISNWDDLMDDFDKLVFDIDMVTKEITISDKSPLHITSIIQDKFYREFNPNFLGNARTIDRF
ncbi:hypothetical protein MTsPCn9_29900 [Croceitalea sp. MTPC9]|nr:hypothetical protein MTsPCn6_21760 [Croceitalea sp. MTPC6]GMN18050.1 hypothetical protein MTsPCn9_29900 [Croceitalea sp. MTPC9]